MSGTTHAGDSVCLWVIRYARVLTGKSWLHRCFTCCWPLVFAISFGSVSPASPPASIVVRFRILALVMSRMNRLLPTSNAGAFKLGRLNTCRVWFYFPASRLAQLRLRIFITTSKRSTCTLGSLPLPWFINLQLLVDLDHATMYHVTTCKREVTLPLQIGTFVVLLFHYFGTSCCNFAIVILYFKVLPLYGYAHFWD